MSDSTELPTEPTSSAIVRGGRWKKHLVELVTITVGVLIALSLEGVRQWMNDRQLVREAEAVLLLEIRENRDELERVLESVDSWQVALDTALLFANELLEDGTTVVDSLALGFTLAEVSSASWITAERTGAIAHMDYGRVRELSRVYEAQALFVGQQRQSLARLASALAILGAGDDPLQSDPEDLRAFRSELLGLRAELFMQVELAERTRSLYEELLAGHAGPEPPPTP